MSKFRTPGREGFTRRSTLVGGLRLIALATGAKLSFILLPGSSGGRALAASEKELMESGSLPENVLGEATAPNTVVEYASMTCPHCASFHAQIFPELKSKYIETGKVRFFFREFPLDNLAVAASMLARCAGPDKYFPFIDALFVKQEEWAFGEGAPVDRLFKIAQQAGFTKASFEKCLRDQKLLDGIIEVRKRGHEKFGVQSTPTIFVNGEKVRSVRSLADIEKHLEETTPPAEEKRTEGGKTPDRKQ